MIQQFCFKQALGISSLHSCSDLPACENEICSAFSARLLEEIQSFKKEKVTDDRILTLPWNMIQKQNTTVSNDKVQSH
jgi:hypothetical protein